MKKARFLTVILVMLGLLFSAANVFADSALAIKPTHVAGAKATEKAGEHASNGNKGQGNGQGAEKTPGAKATEKAIEHATEGKGNAHKGKRTTYRGTVTAVGGSSLTLALDGGGSMTFAVTGSTRIHIPTLGRDATLADVHTGVQAMVQVLKDDASLTALYVHVIPGKPEPVHRVGIVTAYTPGASITVLDKKGGSSTFVVTADTKILPKDRAGQLGVGSLVTIISRRDPTGGPLTAQGIVVHPVPGTEEPETEEAETEQPETEEAEASATPTVTPLPTATSTPTATP
jgi:hypothetical protein